MNVSLEMLKVQLAQCQRQNAVLTQQVSVWQAYFAWVMRKHGMTQALVPDVEFTDVIQTCGIRMKQVMVRPEGAPDTEPERPALMVTLVSHYEAKAAVEIAEAAKPVLRLAR